MSYAGIFPGSLQSRPAQVGKVARVVLPQRKQLRAAGVDSGWEGVKGDTLLIIR